MYRIFHNKQEVITALVRSEDIVLDVGFWGQGIGADKPQWVHSLLRERAREVYGVDLEYDEEIVQRFGGIADHYRKDNAETFRFQGVTFDCVVSSELIEHLSNPGLFLDACKQHLAPNGRLVLTTPNCFNLFNIAGKLMHQEPVVNSDHTCYFNEKTLRVLLAKNGWRVVEVAFVYTLDVEYVESLKKKVLNVLYRTVCLFTPKYLETLVVVAQPEVSQLPIV